jgi:L-ascorbate metabolism protein UlaG (beta-lactamase superfamily)
MLRGQALIDDMHACQVATGEVAAWWLGQHGFAFKTPASVLYLDAFLSPLPERLFAPQLSPEQVTNAAWIVGTHDHADHIDRGAWPAMAAASPNARFIVPDLLLPRLAEELALPLRRFIGLDDGKTVQLAPDLSIAGIAAAHERLDPDPASGKFPRLGVVVQAGACTFYHSGDCCLYEGLVAKLKRFSPRAMFLPINGRDARRLAVNCIGNMTYQEAADLAGALAPRLTVPAHWDMFRMNSEDPQKLVDYMAVKYPGLGTAVPRHGERVVL